MAARQRYRMYVDGPWVSAASAMMMPSLNLYSGEPWAEVPDPFVLRQ